MTEHYLKHRGPLLYSFSQIFHYSEAFSSEIKYSNSPSEIFLHKPLKRNSIKKVLRFIEMLYVSIGKTNKNLAIWSLI